MLPLSVLLERVDIVMFITLFSFKSEMVIIFVINVFDNVFRLRLLVLIHGIVLV